MTTATVIKCLRNLFCILGLPSYVHSDRGSAFRSSELKKYLTERGIATSKSTTWPGSPTAFREKQESTISRRSRAHGSKLAHIRFPDGRESTVSVTNLAPCPCKTTTFPESNTYHDKITDDEQPTTTSDSFPLHNCHGHESISSDTVDNLSPLLPHPQITLLDLTLLTLYFPSLLSYADLLEIPPP